MTLSVKPNFRVCGKMFGKNIGEYSKALEELSEENKQMLYIPVGFAHGFVV